MKQMTWMAVFLLVGAAAGLVACGGAATPTTAPEEALDAIVAQAVADQLGVDVDAVDIGALEPAQWPDACLGLPAADEICAQVVTPGYGGLVEAAGQQYEFRASQDGRTVRLIPGAALSARQVLAQQLHINLDTVRFVALEQVEWPDACLGAAADGELCAEVVTSGYRVTLAVDGQHYELHTDELGRAVRVAQAPEPNIPDAALFWTGQDQGVCQTAAFGHQAVAFGPCGAAQMTGAYTLPARAAALAHFVETYAPFEAETAAGRVRLSGQGGVVASAAEQRMVAEWARLAAQEAAMGRGGASWGLALAWHREGGIAGFCDDLAVYVTGDVFASSCRSGQPEDVGRGRLTPGQLQQVYDWLDGLQLFELEQRDPATADAMTIRLLLSGTGPAPVTDADREAIQRFAAEVYAEVSSAP